MPIEQGVSPTIAAKQASQRENWVQPTTSRGRLRCVSLKRFAVSLIGRGTSLAAALAVALQPLMVELARAQVIADPAAPIEFRPGIGSSGNGVPVVDIVTPSFGGLSHNKFDRYNVDTNGLILNNSGLGGQSIIGGSVHANPNLVGRQPARTILNEVTGTSVSTLAGTTEVFGARADVIVANPNGVGCVGCSFINAGRITLSSGVPIPDYARGTVDFDVSDGLVSVSGSGLSGVPGLSGIDEIDLIGRRIGIDGAVEAQERVRLRAGAMRYSQTSDTASAIAGAPVLAGDAIVSSAAGVINAGSISVISRDVDLGVVMAGRLTSDADSIVMASMGELLLGDAESAADLQLQAQDGLELNGRYDVDGRLTAAAENIALVDGGIAAGDAVILESRDALSVRGQVSSGSDASFIADGALDARGRILAGGRAALEGDSITTDALELGGRDVTVIAQDGLALGAGTIAALDDIAIVGEEVQFAQGLDFGAPGRFFVVSRGDFENATILDHANLALSIGGSFSNAATGVYLRDELALMLTGDLVNEGLIQGLKSTTISARALDNRTGGVIDAPLVTIGLSGDAGNAGTIHGADGVTLEAASLINALDGRIAGNGVAITLDGGLANLGEILSPHALTIVSDGLVENDGSMAAGGALSLQAVSYIAGSPAARLADASAQLTLSGLIDNAGIIAAGGPLGLVAQSLENRSDAVILSEAAATLTLTQDATNHGLVLADGALTLAARDIDNTTDAVLYGADLAITTTGALANAGTLLSESVAALTLAGSYASQGGILRASQRIDLTAATISAQGPSEILAPVIDLTTTGNFQNAGEIIATDLLVGQFGGAFGNTGVMHALAPDGAGHVAEMALDIAGAATNAGEIRAEGDLFFNAGSLTQQPGGHLEGARLALGLTGSLDNRGVIHAEGDLAIEAAWLVNSGNATDQAWISGLDLSIVTSGAISAGGHSVLEGRRSTTITASSSNIDLTNSASITQGRFNFGQALDLTMTGQALTVGQGTQIMAAGDLSLNFAQGITVLGSIASGGNLALAAPGGSILVGTNGSWNPGGAFLFTLGDADFTAGGSMLLSSSAVEVLGSADVSLGGTLSIARASGPVWQFSHTEQVLGSRLWQLNWFRQQETSNASVFNVAERLEINANDVAVNASTLSAGGDLVVHANAFSNTANQLQQYYDLYKLTGKNTGYRGTVHSAWSATPSLIHAGGAFSVNAQSFSNTGTVQANQGVIRAPSVSVGVTDRNTFTAPPSLPDPVIDLGRYVAQLPDSMQRPEPRAISIDGPQYLFTAPLAGQPRYDADGLPVSEREPSWILRQVGDVRGTNGQGITFLADPITERMLIQRALVEQTGRSMLDPVFDSAIAQQEALYEGTVSFLLDNPEISLGDTLTAAQRARVDAPMLWYVEREIDGVRVLAPELILPESRLAAYGYQPGGSVRTVESLFIEGDSVRNTGALVAGSGLTILAGEFINERRVAAFRDGRNLHSRIQAGGLVSADDLMIITDGDLINRGGTLYGTQALTLAAGGDIRFEAQRVVNDIRSRGNAVGSWSHYSERHYAASAGTAGDMQIVADGGLSLLGSRLMADGDIALSARDGISVASVTDIEENHESRRSNRFFSRRSTSFGETGALNLGSLIAAGGDLGAVTAGDIAIHASDLTAGDDLLLAAGAGEDGRADASITITAGTDNRARYHQEKTSAVGLFFGGGRLDFYRARNTREETMQADNRPSTLTAGGDARLVAPGDVTLQGSVVGAGGMAELIAGRDLAVTAGEEARERLFSERRSNFGFSVAASGGGASLSLGLTRSSVRDDRNRTSDVGSLIGGGEGVRLEAGRDLSVVAAELTSPGDIDLLAGRDLGVSPGAIVETHRRVERHSFAGVTASVGTNVVSAAQDLGRAVDTFGSGYGNAGYRAIGMASGVLQGVDAVRSLSNPGVSASLSLGFSQSRMSQTEQLSDVVPAYFDAGGDLTFAAGRDLSLRAVQARSGGDLLLSAGRDLAIESAQATYWRAQRHSSASASVGLDMGWSVAGGPSVGVTLSGQVAGGRADASGTGQVESTLQAGRTLAVLTGNDALIAGAQLRGRDVALDIGGDLHVASRADTARLRGSSYQAGASLTIGLIGPSSLSLNLGGGRERADSTLVNRQTSIIADERLDAYVDGHTQLDGGLIASLLHHPVKWAPVDGQDVEQKRDLSLDTGTLSFTDIDERARSDSRRASASIGLGGNAADERGGWSFVETNGRAALLAARSSALTSRAGSSLRMTARCAAPRDRRAAISLGADVKQERRSSVVLCRARLPGPWLRLGRGRVPG